MTAIATSAPLDQVCMGAPAQSQVPIDAAKKIVMGQMVALLTATGYATDPDGATTGAVLGVAEADADNSADLAGAMNANVLEGLFWLPSHSGNPPVITDVGKVVYAKDNHAISNSSADGPVAGVLYAIDTEMGCLVYVSGENNYLLSQSTLASDLASVANGDGANLIGYEDDGAKTTAATVDEALDEIYLALKAKKEIHLPLASFVLAANGAPLGVWSAANDGTCGLYCDGTKAMGIRWNNTAGTTITVATTFKVPKDVHLATAAVVKVKASKVGATLADATTIIVGMYAQTEGALYDAGANLGVTTGAMTGDAATKTVQLVSGTLTVFPDAASGMTLTLNPTAAKLATDDLIIHDVWIECTPDLMAA